MEDLEALRAHFNDLWTSMHVDETLWPHRYAATFGLWRKRSWKTGGETGEDLVQVRYNGLFKICTRETMNLFNLEFVKNWN